MMRLSEAIKLGAMLHPQGFGGMHVNDGTCALGAAEDAGFNVNALVDETINCAHRGQHTACPECAHPCCGVGGVVVHLNDCHRLTREAIADWVATIEPPDAIEPARQPAPAHADATNAIRLSTDQPVVTIREVISI